MGPGALGGVGPTAPSGVTAMRCGHENHGLRCGPGEAAKAMRPPGRKGEAMFRNAATGSEKNMRPKRDATRSKAYASNAWS